MTNYTYTSGRPAANLSPASQRASMQTNNDNNALIWTEDHYGFNDNDGGLHKKSTYPVQASDPGSAASQLVQYSKTSNSSSELFFERDNSGSPIQVTYGTATNSTGSSTNSTANWQTFLPGGLQMKGGRITGGATTGTITYTAEGMTAFPTATLQVQLTPFLQTSNSIEVTNITSTTFAWAQSGTGALYWIAIGY